MQQVAVAALSKNELLSEPERLFDKTINISWRKSMP